MTEMQAAGDGISFPLFNTFFTMDSQHLHDLLAQLHTELSRGEELDENNRRLLQAVRDDIERVAAAPASGEHGEVRGRLQEAALNFQTSHPRLATNLESTMNALSNLGL